MSSVDQKTRLVTAKLKVLLAVRMLPARKKDDAQIAIKMFSLSKK